MTCWSPNTCNAASPTPATRSSRSGCGRAAVVPRRATDGLTVTRVVDSSGYVSFAGTNYRVGNAWRGRPVQVCIVADSVQLSCDGQIVRVHPIRHDRAKEHGAFATPNGRPRHREDAPAGVGVKATPLRGRPTGRALTPTPHTGAFGSDAEPPDPHNDVDHVKATAPTSPSSMRCSCTRPATARRCVPLPRPRRRFDARRRTTGFRASCRADGQGPDLAMAARARAGVPMTATASAAASC